MHDLPRFKLIPAVHLFLTRDDQVLLLRRHNTGYEDGKYSVIAGHLDGDEEVTTAAIREAREEAGIEIEPADIAMVGVMHRRSPRPHAQDERVDFFVRVTRWRGTLINAEPHKCAELTWCALNHLPDDTIPYVRCALDNFRTHDGVWFESFGWERYS
ncbi:MAG TPA: NUDIX domain-containing protein [Ktedonobacterales bacterium]|jgi:8-oxo-dGTP pyrophosphatase MutT (NUDIX family)|nr:NUDIX domain-containing protein [Ktedonobacterales bacterium]